VQKCLIRRVLDWMIGFIASYTFTARDYRQYSAIAILHTLQFIVAHAVWFSVFTSRILATDLWQSHCNFKSHMKPSLYRLIPFLPLICNCQFWRLDSIPRFRSLYTDRLASRTRLFTSRPLFCFLVCSQTLLITLKGSQRRHSLCC
jgi:hypothetical protein